MKPKIIKTEGIYHGKIFSLSIAEIEEEGVKYSREIISHPGSAVIVPVFSDGRVALVRQYRHPAAKYLLELPAGSLAPGEDAKEGAARELKEEVGVVASSLEKLTEFYVSPGFLGEKMFVFLAAGLEEVGQSLESDELLGIEAYSFPEAFSMISGGMIEDAKTICGLLLAGARLGFSFPAV